MAVANGDSAASADLDVKPPENIVIPPPNVRVNVAKTADFVFRRGEAQLPGLKARIANDPKSQLTFVTDDDPYNPYFLWYLEQLQAGHGPAAKGNAQPIPEKPKGPPEPAKFRFSARMPNISAKDLEVLKLTALYTARVGENWLKELRNRESGNFQFDFLRPNHSFFQFFRSLVDQYKILLEEEQTVEARIADLQENVKNRFHVLERAKGRAEYVKYISAQKEKEEKKAEDEKREYATIDWHDFTVIATVLFDEADDAADLPPPALLNDLQSQSLEQKAAVSLSTRRLEEAMPDESTYYNATQQNAPQQAYPVPPPMPVAPVAYPQYAPPPQDYSYMAAQRQREDEQARAQAEADARARQQAATRGAPGRIVTDYVPRAAKKANVATVVCPNCKQNIPAAEIDEHIRSRPPPSSCHRKQEANILLQSNCSIPAGKNSETKPSNATRQQSIRQKLRTTSSASPVSVTTFMMVPLVCPYLQKKKHGGRRQLSHTTDSQTQPRTLRVFRKCSP